MRRIDVDVDEIVRLYATEGLRAAEIGRRLGCNPSVVLARLAEAGVRRSRRARLDREEVIRRYVEEGWPLTRLGAAHGVAPTTIASNLRRWGVPTRSHVESLQPRNRLPCPRSLAFRGYLLGFVWGDLAVEQVMTSSLTVSVRGSTTHEEQRMLIDDLFGRFGPIRWSEMARSSCVRVSLDRSFAFLFQKYSGEVPAWVTGPDVEAAFAAGYTDAEGSFGVYDGRGRFKIDAYDAGVLSWLAEWMGRSGISCRHRLVRQKGDPRPDGGTFNGDLWRINVNEPVSLLRLAATLGPFLRHGRRRARMDDVVANIHERLRTRVFL